MNLSDLRKGEIPDKLENKINGLKDRSLHLSASKLKNMDSPINFTKSLVKRKSNYGMTFGGVVDCLLTDVDHFFDRYIVSESELYPGKQVDVMNKVLDEILEKDIDEKIEEVFNSQYKRSNNKTLEKIKFHTKAKLSGKDIISNNTYEKALDIVENLIAHPEINEVLENAKFQKELGFKYRDWKFLGYIDALWGSSFYDFKLSSKLNPDFFVRDVDRYGYDIQFATYYAGLKALGHEDIKGYFIVFDKEGNFMFREMAYDYMKYGERKMNAYIDRLEKIIEKDAWLESYDFFQENKKIHKPKWAQGFENEQ